MRINLSDQLALGYRSTSEGPVGEFIHLDTDTNFLAIPSESVDELSASGLEFGATRRPSQFSDDRSSIQGGAPELGLYVDVLMTPGKPPVVNITRLQR